MEAYTKRRFGQHFLRDTGVLNRIVRSIAPMPDDLIVEIGSGDGALSVRLAPKVSRFITIEVDRQWIAPLQAALSPYPQAYVVRGDIMEIDLPAILLPYLRGNLRLRFVGNLPYNIATATIDRLLHQELPVVDMVFMVQLEVAERIIAKPGCRQYGFLSINCQHRAEIHFKFRVAPACFVPRPKVMSALIALYPRRREKDPSLDRCFTEVVKAAFGYRRKTLINSLHHHGALGPIADELLKKAGLDGDRRPEDITVEEFEQLALQYQRRLNTEGSG